MCSHLYIHIPFCIKKCPYCSFYSISSNDEDFHNKYLEAVIKEIELHRKKGVIARNLKTVFLGGGTPSLLSISCLDTLFSYLNSVFSFNGTTETSVEVNPGTADREKFRQLKEFGVNRVSVGVQSFDDEELVLLGRQYSSKQAHDCLDYLNQTGFTNISGDLIYGVPAQTENSWKKNLSALLPKVHHLSLYQLTIEEKTPFERWLKTEKLVLPEESVQEKIEQLIELLIGDSCFEKYEISNYSIPGYRCIHNINYWKTGDYVGVGAGAVSYFGGTRYFNTCDVVKYVSQAKRLSFIAKTEDLSVEDKFREAVVIGMRMVEGVEFDRLRKKFGMHPQTYYKNILGKLIERGAVELTDTHMRLTKRGMEVANYVLSDLV